MNSEQLRNLLGRLNISQVELAKLLKVTPRGVNNWLAGSRNIPGPVSAYVNLLARLPEGIFQLEYSRIEKEIKPMKEGMYLVDLSGSAGSGVACLVFENGTIYGVDNVKVSYDGSYKFNEIDGMIDVELRITVPPNVSLVQGRTFPIGTSFQAKTKVKADHIDGTISVNTDLGTVSAKLTYLRALPKAA